jgi:uncharacterized protein YkwD
MNARNVIALVLVFYALLIAVPAGPCGVQQCKADGPVETIIRRTPVVRRLVGSAQENEVVRLVNIERTRRGLRPLATNDKMMHDARGWSEVQASRRRMYHSRMGYAENVAYGQTTPQEVVRTWMNSPGHRRNILSPSRSQIGVGLAYGGGGRPYWTQVFN